MNRWRKEEFESWAAGQGGWCECTYHVRHPVRTLGAYALVSLGLWTPFPAALDAIAGREHNNIEARLPMEVTAAYRGGEEHDV